MKLDNRLKAIAAMVPEGKTLADIGTDHAYLPVYLIKKGRISRAIAGDINKGPVLAAQKTIKEANLEENISVRMGDGLKIISPYEVGTVVIAGMGGKSIIEILSQSSNVTLSCDRLILQPMTGAAEVRRYLIKSNWKLIEEDLVLSETKDKIYQVIAAEKGPSPEFDPILYYLGPLLWERRHPLLKALISEQINLFKYIAANMEKSPLAISLPKYHTYLEKISQLEYLSKELED